MAQTHEPRTEAVRRVVDATTGEEMTHVIEADEAAGRVVRFKVEDGNLVREGDTLVTVTEDRAIRVEEVEEPALDPIDLGETA